MFKSLKTNYRNNGIQLQERSVKNIKEISAKTLQNLIKIGVIKEKHMHGNIPEIGQFSSGYFTSSNKHVGVVKTKNHIYIEDYFVNKYGY